MFAYKPFPHMPIYIEIEKLFSVCMYNLIHSTFSVTKCQMEGEDWFIH